MLDANDCYAVLARLASAYSVRPFMADSRLMHYNIMAHCRKAALSGKNRPGADDF
jgi:hypothetical protein